jgi:tRNA(Ile)-lysidine synthase TilS/MesJ
MSTQFSLPSLCSRCILPETFPGISFDERGVCNYCRREEPALVRHSEKKALYRLKLDQLIQGSKGQDSGYDVIAAYSGGKDSSYTLKLLKKRYGARILALTFDNHFVSPRTWTNIRNVVDRLGIDHLTFRPNWPIMKSLFSLAAGQDLFPKPSLLRASSICTACIGLVKSLTLKTALEMSIPFVAFGWSPGQAPLQAGIMKNNPVFVRENQKAFRKALPAEIAESLEVCFIPASYDERHKDRFPYNIHPLAFFDYDEEEIKSEIEALGWEAPTNTDTNSTNCLLNALANEGHLKRHRFHPYVLEIANMVRQGVMTREEGLEKIYSPQDPEQVAYAREKLGL